MRVVVRLVRMVVRRVRAGLLLLVLGIVRVQVRGIRTIRIITRRTFGRGHGDLVLVDGADARRAFVAGDAQHLVERRVAELAPFNYRGRI